MVVVRSPTEGTSPGLVGGISLATAVVSCAGLGGETADCSERVGGSGSVNPLWH